MRQNETKSKQNIYCSLKVTRIMSVWGLNIRLKIPYTPCTGDRGSKFRVAWFKFAVSERALQHVHVNILRKCRDEQVTRTIFCMYCDLDRFCLWFISLCPWWSSHTRKDLTQGASVSSAGSAERCAGSYQIISLFNVSFMFNVEHTSRIM